MPHRWAIMKALGVPKGAMENLLHPRRAKQKREARAQQAQSRPEAPAALQQRPPARGEAVGSSARAGERASDERSAAGGASKTGGAERPGPATQTAGTRPASRLPAPPGAPAGMSRVPGSAPGVTPVRAGEVLRQVLGRDDTHPVIVVAPGQMTHARRAMYQVAQEEGWRIVYADDPAMLRDQEHDLVLHDGRPQAVDGPFRQLLADGGTLLLNGMRFSSEQIERLNSLMADQEWDGQPIACLQRGRRVKVALLVDSSCPLEQLVSGALGSRVTECDELRSHVFGSSEPELPVQPPHECDEQTLQIEPRGDDYARWRHTLFGGVAVSEDQQWVQEAGRFDGVDLATRTVVLRLAPPAPGAAPPDTRFTDWLHDLQQQYPDRIRLEAGWPAEEAARRLALKQPPAGFHFGQLLASQPQTVCTLNPDNFEQVLWQDHGERQGRLARLPSRLQQVKALPGQPRPVVLVTEPLGATQWYELMHDGRGFTVVAAPGVPVDNRYLVQVQRTQSAPWRDAPSLETLRLAQTWQAPVTLVHAADPSLLDGHWPEGSLRVDVTPNTRVSDLLYELKRGDPDPATGVPGLQLQKHQGLRALEAGEVLVLYGCNAELERELAPLLHPPHELVVSGQRIVPRGRLVLVTPDRGLLERHGLSARMRDPAPPGLAWRQAATRRLAQALQVPQAEARALLDPVIEWFQFVQDAGVEPVYEPPARYAEMEKVCHILHRLRRTDAQAGPLQARLLRSLLKDQLLAQYRQPHLVHDTRYSMLKACLKVLLPAETSAMSPRSVEPRRLQALLDEVRHPRDIEALAWQFLDDAFTPDVIAEVIGQPVAAATRADAQQRIAARVVDLVVGQARALELKLPPLVAQWPAGADDTGTSQAHIRPARLDRDLKLRGKLLEAQSMVQGMFLVGPPGSGKTTEVHRLAGGTPVFWASVAEADDGVQAFHDTLQAWATGRPPGTLVVDEANLARRDIFGMLQSVFARGTLFVNGRVHELTSGHRVIFMGNANALTGRNPQQVVQDRFATVQLKPMHTDYLQEHFLDEGVFPDALGVQPLQGWLAADPALRPALQQVGEQALQVHERLLQVYPQAGLSPRDLQECLARLLAELVQRPSAPDADELAPLLASVSLQVYGGRLPPHRLPVVRAWLYEQLNLSQKKNLPQLFDSQAVTQALVDARLAPTRSTVELGGTVHGWLRSLRAREAFNPPDGTFGKRTMLISGSASRGKDRVTGAMLVALGLRKGIDFVHLNADPNDWEGLKQAIVRARELGQIVVVSELDLLPSGILEGEFNEVMTGPAAPGFAMIFTINAGYKGRQPLAQPLLNRMFGVNVEDYHPDEWLPICQTLRDGRDDAHRVSEAQLSQLVELLIELRNDLRGAPAEFRPGVRQLERTIGLLAQQPASSVGQAFAQVHGFYRSLADQVAARGMAAGPSPQTRLITQLGDAMALAEPRVHPPGLLADPSLPPDTPVVYDAREHQLRFAPEADVDDLTSFLLEQLRNGHLFVGSIDTARAATSRRPPRQPAAPPASVLRIPASSLKPSSNDLPSFSPTQRHVSGLGTAQRHDAIGSVDNAGPRDDLFAVSRVDVLGARWPTPRRQKVNESTVPPDAARVYLPSVPMECVSREHRVYLPAPTEREPAAVRLDLVSPARVERDEHGGWYVVPVVQPDTTGSLAGRPRAGRVSYRLIDATMPEADIARPPQRLPAEFGDLQTALNQPLLERLLVLKERQPQLSRTELVRHVAMAFRATSTYDEQAVIQASSLGERCRAFLRTGRGVCFESAHSCAAVLVQMFGITEVRVGFGFAREDTLIQAESHAWVEVKHAAGRWHAIDPTAQQQSTPDFSPRTEPSLHGEALDVDVADEMLMALPELTQVEPQRGAEVYHPTTGRFDPKRAVSGGDMFRRRAVASAVRPRPLAIAGLAGGSEELSRRFWTTMQRPLAALRHAGVAVLMPDPSGAWVPAGSNRTIEENTSRFATPPVAPEGAAVLNRWYDQLASRIASAYYEALLRRDSVNLDRLDDVKLRILADVWRRNAVVTAYPIVVYVHGRRVVIEKADADRFWHYTLQWLDHAEANSEAILAAGTGDGLHRFELELERAMTVFHTRVRSEPGYEAHVRRLELLATAFLERGSPLTRQPLVALMVQLFTSPTERFMDALLDRWLTKRCPPDIEAYIASETCVHFWDIGMPRDTQEALLTSLERHAGELSATTQVEVAWHLICNIPEKAFVDPGVLNRCMRLCSQLLQASAARADVSRVNATYAALATVCRRPEPDVKSWALSQMDDLSRHLVSTPTGAIEGYRLLSGVNEGDFPDEDHQRVVTRILERSFQAESIGTSSLRWASHELQNVLLEPKVSRHLIPRYEAMRERLARMNIVE